MEKKKAFIVNVLFYAIIGGIIFAVCKLLLPVLVPFIIAFIVGGAVYAVTKKIAKEREGMRKLLSVLLCAIFYVALFSIVLLAGAKVMKAAANMIAAAPTIYNQKIVPLIWELSDWLGQKISFVDTGVSQEIEVVFADIAQNMGQFISDFSVKGVKWLTGGIAGIPGFIVKLVITVVSTFFMALDFPKIAGLFRRLIPENKQKYITEGKNYVCNVALIYIKSYCLLFLLTFVELCVGLLLFHIPYAVLIALAIAVFDILPVLGTGGVLLPWAAILLIMGNKILAIEIIVLYIVITVIRNIAEPKLVGKQIGLHPLAALMAMFVGLKIFGIIGMIGFPLLLSFLVNIGKTRFHADEPQKENEN